MRTLRRRLGLSQAAAATLLRVAPRTFARWERLDADPRTVRRSPHHWLALDVLRDRCAGVPIRSPAWAGFRIFADHIRTPAGDPVRPNDLQWLTWQRGHVAELERRLTQPQQWRLL